MRIWALVVAVALLVFSLFSHGWAHADMSGADYNGARFTEHDAYVAVGLRTSVSCDNGDCETRGIEDYDKIDRAGRSEGGACLLLGLVAALGFVVAGGCALAKQRIPIVARIVIALAALLSLILTIVFAVRLSHVSWMKLGWAPFVAIGCAILGAVATLASDPREREPAR